MPICSPCAKLARPRRSLGNYAVAGNLNRWRAIFPSGAVGRALAFELYPVILRVGDVLTGLELSEGAINQLACRKKPSGVGGACQITCASLADFGGG